MSDNLSIQDVRELIRAQNPGKIKVAITDTDGVLRGKYIHQNKLLSALDSGFGFCSVVFGWDSADKCYDHGAFAGWHNGYPDTEVRLDPMTFRTVPWEQNVPFLLGDFYTKDQKPLEICPRQLLRKIANQAESKGFLPQVGMEFEWFNFAETAASMNAKGYVAPNPITPGMFGYSLLRSGENREFFTAIMDELGAFKVPIEGLHTETGPGVYEAALLYDHMLEAADRAVLFKAGVKEIGHRFGIMPSFMARWNTSLPGCSGHIHQSLINTATGDNEFYDATAPNHMSKTFEHFIAGQMHCLPHILPMFAPTVNSYKRLVEGFWAPTRVTWGVDNRTACLRVVPGSSKSLRLETRVGGSDVNPYLAIAASIASGLYGIERKLELPSGPVKGNAYTMTDAPVLPGNLESAATMMRESKVAKELFGEMFVEHFTYTRLWEWRESQQAVTDWELKRYFEII